MAQSENLPAAAKAAGSANGADVYNAVPVIDDALNLVSIKQLTGKKVWEIHSTKGDTDTLKKIGRVLAFVFHPTNNRCVGFLVKRPDAALMFHRKDLFVGFGGFDIIEGHIVAGNTVSSKGKGALKAAGVDLDDCVLWQGMPVVCENGSVLGTVGDVLCEEKTGEVHSLEISKGATANTLLGTLTVSPDEILGFRIFVEKGKPDSRSADYPVGHSADPIGNRFPAIMVKNVVQDRPVAGGVAEKAGNATAVITHNAKQAINKVKPKAKEATAAAGDAINKGAYIAGRQIERSKGMFSAFKEEFDKALHEDGEEDKDNN